MNTKDPPPCPPGVKPMQVLPSEVNFTRPSEAARAAYAERRLQSIQPISPDPTPSSPASHTYRSQAVPAPTSRPKAQSPKPTDTVKYRIPSLSWMRTSYNVNENFYFRNK